MDMTWSTDHADYPGYFKLFLLFLVLYPWPILGNALRASRQGLQPSARMIYALSIPGALALVLVWWGYGRLVTLLAVSGSGSQIIRAAGVAEAQVPLFLASLVGSFLSLVVSALYRHRWRSSGPEPAIWLPVAVFIVTAAATLAVGWWLVRSPLHEKPFGFMWFGIGSCFVLSMFAVARLFIGKSRSVTLGSTLLFAVAYPLIALAAWWFMQLHRDIAMGLQAG